MLLRHIRLVWATCVWPTYSTVFTASLGLRALCDHWVQWQVLGMGRLRRPLLRSWSGNEKRCKSGKVSIRTMESCWVESWRSSQTASSASPRDRACRGYWDGCWNSTDSWVCNLRWRLVLQSQILHGLIQQLLFWLTAFWVVLLFSLPD